MPGSIRVWFWNTCMIQSQYVYKPWFKLLAKVSAKILVFEYIYSSQLQILLVCVQFWNPITTQYLMIWHTSSNSSEISNSVRNYKFCQILRSIWNKFGEYIVKPPCLGLTEVRIFLPNFSHQSFTAFSHFLYSHTSSIFTNFSPHFPQLFCF